MAIGGPYYGGYYPGSYYGGYCPATATIRSTMVGKQSKNLGPPASTDLTDTAAALGL